MVGKPGPARADHPGAAALRAQHPATVIEYEYGTWNDYWTRLTTQAAGNDLPDVMQQDYQYLTEWVGRGLIVPLDAEVAAGTLELSDATESSLAGGRVGGRLYGVSLGTNSVCMMLDVDAFARAGLPLPPDDWTWTDFERLALALTRKLGIPAVSGNIVHDHVWRSMYLGQGPVGVLAGRHLPGVPGGRRRAVRRPPRHGPTAHRRRGHDPLRRHRVPAVQGRRGRPDRARGNRSSRSCGATRSWPSWTAAGIESRHFALRPLPRVGPRAGSSNYLKPAQFLSVTRNASSARVAAALVDWFTNSIDANMLLMAERGVPISAKVREALKPHLAAPQLRVFEYLDRIQHDVAPIPPPDPVGNTDLINNVFIPRVVDPVMFGVISPLEGMRLLRREALRILGG